MSPKPDPVTVRRSHGLRQAASTVFVLTAVLPLLIVTWTLYRLRALEQLEVQVALILALAVALLGFAVFRSLMAQLSDVILALRTLVAWRSGAREEAKGVSTSSSAATKVSGLGEISELRDSQGTITAMWQSEASAYLGRAVLVHVRNSSDPIAGTLLEVTPDGVLVQHDGKQVAIGYLRFQGIELAGA